MQRISGVVVFLIASAIFWQGRGLSIGTPHAPGPGFFPMLIGATLVLLSVILMIRGGKGTQEQAPVTVRSLVRMLVVFAALLAYFLLLEYIGFVVTSFLLMAFLFLSVARQKWYFAVASSVVCIGLSYLLFAVLRKSNLPKGVFGF